MVYVCKKNYIHNGCNFGIVRQIYTVVNFDLYELYYHLELLTITPLYYD